MAVWVAAAAFLRMAFEKGQNHAEGQRPHGRINGVSLRSWPRVLLGLQGRAGYFSTGKARAGPSVARGRVI